MVGTNLEGQLHYGSDAGWPVESRDGKFLRFEPLKEFKVDYIEYHNLVHTNEWGGRVTSGPKISPAKPFIPVLGDSFAFGLGVEDKQTFVSLLSSTSKIPYLNLAAPGSSLPNDLDIIEMRHQELGCPRLYLISFYLGNDFAGLINYYEGSNPEIKDKDSHDKFLNFLQNNKWMARSYLAQFVTHSMILNDHSAQIKHRTRLFRMRGGQKLGNSLYLMMGHSRGYCSLVHKLLNRTLDRLDKLAETLHFKVGMIIIPDKHQTDKTLFLKQAGTYDISPSELDPFYPNQLLTENLEKRGIKYVDVTRCLSDHKGLYYKIDDHFTAEGHRVVADCINQDLKFASIVKEGTGGKN